MALSSRAHAFSVEALVGTPSKRKLQDPREKARPELQEKEGEEEKRSGAAAKESKQPAEKRPKTEPSAIAFSDCGGSGGGGGGGGGCSGGHLEEKDAMQVELQGSELWKRFHDIGTEMIITKAGRNIYHSSQWMVAGNTDHSCITPRLYVHPDSTCSGETWMQQIINFDHVKLTNNEMDDKGHIILQSMHKYKPRVHVMEQNSRVDLSQIQFLPNEWVKTFSFKETEFITVIAYQNQQITKLKIDRNSFAKGFRDPGRNRCILDGLLKTYPWRPSLTLDFKIFGADTQSGSSGSSPVISNGGNLSPLNSLLSTRCSTPTFRLRTRSLGIPYSEAYLHNINLPLCYKICPSNFWRQQSLIPSAPKRLGSNKSSQPLTPFIMKVPMLSPLGFVNSNNGPPEEFNGQCLQTPNFANQMLHELQAHGKNFTPNAIAKEALGCSFHPSYNFYRYNVPMTSRLILAANHLKMIRNNQVSFRESKYNHDDWHPTINHCL